MKAVLEATRILGDDHPGTLANMQNLATTFSNQGRLKEAEMLDVQVLEMRQKALGQKHPDTLASMIGLVSTYQHQG
jgi:hypothetical protein